MYVCVHPSDIIPLFVPTEMVQVTYNYYYSTPCLSTELVKYYNLKNTRFILTIHTYKDFPYFHL